MLRRYVDFGAYELAIYNGRETLEITDQDMWSSIECDMTIFMNTVLLQSSDKDWRECPVCHTWNYPRDNFGKLVVDWYVIMLLIDDAVHLFADDSRSCDRRLQSEDNINTNMDSTQTGGIYKKDLGLELIRNIRIYKHVGSLIYHNKYSG